MGDLEKKRARELIRQIAAAPDRKAIDELAGLGSDALVPMKDAVAERELSSQAIDALLEALAAMARRDAAPLLANLDEAGQYEEAIVWALGFADPATATRPLIRLLRDPDDGIRQAAARSLVRMHTPEAAEALVPALDDSSHGVQFVAVEALHDDDFFRLPSAKPRLERLVSNRHLREQESEMVRHAREVLQAMER